MSLRPLPAWLRWMLAALPWVVALKVVHTYFVDLHPESPLTFDDAFMFYRYAGNLLHGHGYAWNPGEAPTFGCTSIVYTLIVAVGRACVPGAPAGELLVWTSALLGLLAVAVMALAARAAIGASGASAARWFPWIVAGLCVFFLRSETFLAHARSGMDTTLSLFANAGLVWIVFGWARKGTRTGLALTAVCAYLTYLVRPDNGVYAALFAPLLLLFAFRVEKRRLLIYLLLFAGLMAADALAKIAIFGDPLPLTFYAKRGAYLTGYLGLPKWNPVEYSFEFYRNVLPFLACIVLTARKRDAPVLAASGVPMAITFAFFFSMVQIMGEDFRFYYPSLPFVIVPAFAVLARLSASDAPFAQILGKGVYRAVFLLLLSALSLLHWPLAGAYESRLHRISQAGVDDEPPIHSLGRWPSIEAISELCGRLPPGSLVAASEHGYLGAVNPGIRILDLVGLHDPEIAHHGFSDAYLRRRHPDVIWFPHDDYRGLRKALTSSTFFRQEYEYLPAAADFGLAFRRDLRPLIPETLLAP